MKITILDHYPEEHETPSPGSVYDLGDGLLYYCPGCGEASYLNTSEPECPPCWQRSGELSQLTITPSILHRGECNWHGWLKNGNFLKV